MFLPPFSAILFCNKVLSESDSEVGKGWSLHKNGYPVNFVRSHSVVIPEIINVFMLSKQIVSQRAAGKTACAGISLSRQEWSIFWKINGVGA